MPLAHIGAMNRSQVNISGIVFALGLSAFAYLNGHAPLRTSPAPAPATEFASADKARAHIRTQALGHAALAEGPEGAFGWATNRQTSVAAQQDALDYCGPQCRITLTRAVGMIRHPDLGEAISPHVDTYFEAYRAAPGHKAFAINDGGVTGYWYGAPSRVIARSEALRTCEAYNAERDTALRHRPCRVIHAR